MTDWIAYMQKVMRHGCPNCGRGVRIQRAREMRGDVLFVTDSLICDPCAITWQGEPVPAAELR